MKCLIIAIVFLSFSAQASNVVSFYSLGTGDLPLEVAIIAIQKQSRYSDSNPTYKGIDHKQNLLYFTLSDGSICSIKVKITESNKKIYVQTEKELIYNLESNTGSQIYYNLTCQSQ